MPPLVCEESPKSLRMLASGSVHAFVTALEAQVQVLRVRDLQEQDFDITCGSLIEVLDHLLMYWLVSSSAMTTIWPDSESYWMTAFEVL